MATDNHRFCRLLLHGTMCAVRTATTTQQRKDAWTYRFSLGFDSFEFHGPDDFYWHGSACCKWHARSIGWEAWMRDQCESS